MTSTLFSIVENEAADRGYILDGEQRALLNRLAQLDAALTGSTRRSAPPRSLYIYGDAGRGKSWLADSFYSALPLRRKTRVHFHGFFDELHRSIHKHRDEHDAVTRAIDEVTKNSQLIFFDELHVHDSGDARLLTRLLDHVFSRGLTVLATSNYAPDDLLPNPIWHHTFEPGIALIKTQMDRWHLNGPTDYRTVTRDHSRGFAAGTWSAVLDGGTVGAPTTLTLLGRTFVVMSATNGELVATFEQLCGTATSTVEYLAWAHAFPRWVITDIPRFDDADRESQQRFINLVDVLVDADVTVSFTSTLELSDFLVLASARPDAFRMSSRLRLLRSTTASEVAPEI
ncbi:cell division protein ZapE [Mycetocola zhadangensis]|uniref:cell division protein ZapE n=1 Tax=Mycetocola zhadangensis TaxID=1164595 RepID=UPI0019909A76|nr:cell division protein ZapE [Mycetocola zhadangensis]GGE96397.1 cell division protein ZapE [Mycetocola zhadangensis]